MGVWARDFYGSVQNPVQYKTSLTIADGAVVQREATASEDGEVDIATTTAALNALGCATEAATHSTAQAGPEGLLRLIVNPLAIWKFLVSGTSTAGTALQTAAPAQILTNTSADTAGLTITAAEVGTADFSGGLVKGRTGANAGVIRKLTGHTNSTSTVVDVPFPNTIAVDDTFIRLPYSRAAIAMQVTSDITQADGAIAFGTGIPFNVYDVVIDELNDVAHVFGVFRTHMFNSLA